eukprot:Gregarina_sp_Poly_1__2315@NODE_161_length_12274_cov_73_089211_g143_i0_p1_GENE_NODE_161_length_12274_cov_73_089211_g143_i0NODE_161_length_12274_cov_73_089211_g143_i0_p1_ORF_typecomplete_len914_score104_06Dymeclin/PF09742_9/5_4e18ATP_bind_1/PF03029_17/3e03ATP_bind_1/PF03029_17/21ATP_bind_1/PF03029_17/15_NODE_161_length_12274_cov_73_089211_g143_i019814722
MKGWLGPRLHQAIDSEKFKFVFQGKGQGQVQDQPSAELKSVGDLSEELFKIILHLRYVNPSKPIISTVVVFEEIIPTCGCLGEFVHSIIEFLTSTYQAFFFSSRLSSKACPIATRMECHKSWLSCLLLLASYRSGEEAAFESSSASEMRTMRKLFRSYEEEKKNHYCNQVRNLKSKLSFNSSLVILPALRLYETSCLEIASLLNTEREPLGLGLVQSVIQQTKLADELLYYLLNIFFLYVRGQTIGTGNLLSPSSQGIVNTPYHQIEDYFGMTTYFKETTATVTFGELFSQSESIGYCMNWNSHNRNLSRLSPCLAFDFLPISFRLASCTVFLLLCNGTLNSPLDEALGRFQAFSVLTLAINKQPSRLIFYKSIEDCYSTMVVSSRLRSQTGFAMFYTLSMRNNLFGSVPLASEKSAEMVLSILELLVSIMVSDNPRCQNDKSSLLTLYSSHPSVHMSLSVLLMLTKKDSFTNSLFKQVIQQTPSWLFATQPTTEQSSAEQKRINQLRSRIENMTVGHIMCQVCLRLMEWNLRVHREVVISEYLIGILGNLRRSENLALHWSVCELLVQHLEGNIRLLLSHLVSPQTLINAQTQFLNNESCSEFECVSAVDCITSHLELLAGHCQAICQFVATLVLPENVMRNSMMIYTLVRHGPKIFSYIRELSGEIEESQLLINGGELTRLATYIRDPASLAILRQVSVYRFIRWELLPTCIYIEDVVQLCLLPQREYNHLCRQYEAVLDCQEECPKIPATDQRFYVRTHTEKGENASEPVTEDERSPDEIAEEFSKRLAFSSSTRTTLEPNVNAIFAYRLGAFQQIIRSLKTIVADAAPVLSTHSSRSTHSLLVLYRVWDVVYSFVLGPHAPCEPEPTPVVSPNFKTPAPKKKPTPEGPCKLMSPTVSDRPNVADTPLAV